MKVLLINPPWPGKGFGTRSQNRIIKQRADKFLQYPLYLGYTSAQLKKLGHEVFYIDSVYQELNEEQTNKKVQEIKPDVIIMETTTPSIEYDFKYMTKMKELTNAFIIATGTHVSYFTKEAMEECKAIDMIIKGEYDSRINEIFTNFKHPDKVKGLMIRKDGKVIDTGKPELPENLDSMPFPDRETIPIGWYGEAWYNKRPFINIMTSRGCPYQCTFCLYPNIFEGHKWRKRSIDNVIAELKEVVQKYGVKEINIDDPTFNISKERVIEFCRKLRENKINILWTCNARVDNIDEEMLSEMKKAGCKMIRYGVESGSVEVLKNMKKGITIEQIKRAFTLTKKQGILALGGFMFGFPYDTKKSIEETLKLAKELKPDLIQASIPMAYPGTPLYEEAKRDKKLVINSWSDFDMTKGPIVKTIDMEKKELEAILNRVYKEFYFRPSFVVQTITHIRRPSDISRLSRTFFSLVKTVRFYKKQEAC
jgi:anaerobic magnesium-protoporphyrin IX monomethyl ester cyclase